MRRIRPACLGLLLLLLTCSQRAVAQGSVPGWPNGSVDLNSGWRAQAGDNLAWPQLAFDDSGWSIVELISANDSTGWRWYRLHTEIPASDTPLALLITGGAGTYEVYFNGRRLPGPQLLPDRLVTYPLAQVVPLPPFSGSAVIALRTRIPSSSMFLADRGSLRVALGTLPAIHHAASADFLLRFGNSAASMAAFLLIFSAGIPLLFLFWYQPANREYLWLGCYMLMEAISQLTFNITNSAFVPFSVQWFIGSLFIYAMVVFQIEFTFTFVSQRVTRGWRAYQAFILAYPAFLLLPAWFGRLTRGTFDLGEMTVMLPAALGLPILLFRWYLRGNREAGWLIFPSLLPIITVAVTDLSIFGMNFHHPRLAALGNPLTIGLFSVRQFEVADVLFVVAIGVVMFFRFTSVSREQARSAAELQAAREIQQYLIPAKLPETPGLAIQSAYHPAREVGGDFFQVLPDLRDGSTLVVVGDVAGKGLRAGMLATLIVGAIRTAFRFTSDPGKILALLNERLQGRGLVTCLAMRIDAGGAIELANAGHLPPYLDGKELALDGALPLGALPDIAFPILRLRLHEGQSMVLVSDGVIEAQNGDGELFGFDRTRDLSTQSAEQIAAAAQAHGQEDDITVLTLTFAPAEVLHA